MQLLSLNSSQAQMKDRPQTDYAYILAQMKVQFVRLFLKPPVVVLAHLAQLSSILTLRSVAFCPVAFCLPQLLR